MLFLTLIMVLLSNQVQGWSQPQIRVNPQDLVGPDIVINTDSRLSLTCEGEGPVQWIPRLYKNRRYNKATGNTSSFVAGKANAEFTGTYKCEYINHKDSNFSSIHVFVRDPEVLFVASFSSLRVTLKEGENAVLPCLLTDPAVNDIRLLRSNRTALPDNMNMTYDPKKGMLIPSVQPEYNGDYLCSARRGTTEKVSPVFTITVVPTPRSPPQVTLMIKHYVRLVGEDLEIVCYTANKYFSYTITWSHSSNVNLPTAETKHEYKDGRYVIQSKLMLSALNLNHTGNLTCTAKNEAGTSSSTTHLLVIEEPYIRLTPKLAPDLAHENLTINVQEGTDVKLSVMTEAYPPITVTNWEFSASSSATQPELISPNSRFDDISGEAVMFLTRLNSKEEGQYTFSANSSKVKASVTFSIYLYKKPEVIMRSENESFISCTAFGNPAPEIVWYQCQGTRPKCTENSTELRELVTAQTTETQWEEFRPVKVESVLMIPSTKQKFTIECLASNFLGEDSNAFPIDHSEGLFTATLSGAIAMMAILLLLLIVLLYKYKQKPKYEIRWKIIEATEGNNYTFIDPTQLPYNEKWEFPRDKLKLGKTLGAGAFGKVVQATAYGLGNEENVTRVAVKMLKGSARSDEKEALMSELKILSHLGQHKNIVNLLGACTYGGPVFVITEYCCHGDLLNFLRNKAESFVNCVVTLPVVNEEPSDYKNMANKRLFVRSDSGFSSNSSDSYLDMKPLAPKSPRTPSVASCGLQKGEWPLDMDDLLRFSYQVSQGLEFLAAKNCIHRDVAARNVLLSDGCVAKICDFGLARDIMNDSNYVVKGNARLPVKWMPPESIFDCVYTVQSDVWSYGILLWEIFSMGKGPYPNVLVDSKFYKMIKSGYQMSRPDFASPEIYNIMKMCWNLEPTERPTFSMISQLINRLLGDVPQETQYQNLQSDVLEEQQLETFGTIKNEESCMQEEDDQPLIQSNNYQFS